MNTFDILGGSGLLKEMNQQVIYGSIFVKFILEMPQIIKKQVQQEL
jgi:hypothetical protein